MTQLDLELAALRASRRSPGLANWFRQCRPFDRRAIREPAARDAYWSRVQVRLAESDHAFLIGCRATEPPPRAVALIG